MKENLKQIYTHKYSRKESPYKKVSSAWKKMYSQLNNDSNYLEKIYNAIFLSSLEIKENNEGLILFSVFISCLDSPFI